MNIKLEVSETALLKILQEKVTEANIKLREIVAANQSYAALLSKKYELPSTGKFALSSDFTTIVEVPSAPEQKEPEALPAPAPKSSEASSESAQESPSVS